MTAEREQRKSPWGWRRWRAGLLAALAVLGVLAGADRGPVARREAFRSELQHPESALATDACAGEPELPPLLEVRQDPLDPELWQVQVVPGIEGLAQVTVETAQTAQWIGGRAPQTLRLTHDGARQSFGLRVVRTDKTRPARVRVGLTVRDDQGRIKLTAHKEMDPEPAAKTGAAISTEAPGITAQGEPVLARVPVDAPTPMQTEAGR